MLHRVGKLSIEKVDYCPVQLVEVCDVEDPAKSV